MLVVFPFLFVTTSALAENAENEWRPKSDEFDWIQLVSGEWLKGEIKAMYKESLEFDSDELDMLSLDWEDVKYLDSARVMSLSIEGHGVVMGVVNVSGEKLTVTYGPEVTEFDRSSIVSFTQAGDGERDLWVVKATLSFDLKSGNTNTLDYSAKISAKRRTAKTRLVMDYLGSLSKVKVPSGDLEETANNHRLTGNYDLYQTRRFFYNPAFVEVFRDPFLNIDSKVTLGVGVGYTVIDTKESELTISGGPSYVRTNFVSVASGEPESESSPALAIRTDYDTELSKTVDFIAKYNIQYVDQASGGYTHHIILTLETELTGRLDLDVSLVWDRISEPATLTDDTTPDSDDYRMMFGVTYEY